MTKPSKSEPPTSAEDVLLVLDRTPDSEGFQVLRKRGDKLSAGEVRPAREGRPIQGEVVKLSEREESPNLFDVEVLHDAQPERRQRSGPAQVASRAYLRGWDAIWGKKRSEELN